ncbi:hypothetical protein ENBRE01_2950 [Enteropsectra breve]|nr:hypothetical protein ENBRE01_2950 [Enteropsectra breve]
MREIFNIQEGYYLLSEPKNDAPVQFKGNTIAIHYALSDGLISVEKPCKKCEHTSRICKHSRFLNEFAYRCTNNSCRKYSYIFEILYISEPAIKLCDYFRVLYKRIENCPEKML